MVRRADALTEADFALEPRTTDPLADGEVLVRTLYISLDPYLARAMRHWSGEVEA